MGDSLYDHSYKIQLILSFVVAIQYNILRIRWSDFLNATVTQIILC